MEQDLSEAQDTQIQSKRQVLSQEQNEQHQELTWIYMCRTETVLVRMAERGCITGAFIDNNLKEDLKYKTITTTICRYLLGPLPKNEGHHEKICMFDS